MSLKRRDGLIGFNRRHFNVTLMTLNFLVTRVLLNGGDEEGVS